MLADEPETIPSAADQRTALQPLHPTTLEDGGDYRLLSSQWWEAWAQSESGELHHVVLVYLLGPEHLRGYAE